MGSARRHEQHTAPTVAFRGFIPGLVAFVFHDLPSPCILGTHHEKGAQTFWSVVNRLPLSSNAVLCWKFCHVFHKLLRDGHPNVSSWGCSGWAGIQGPMWGKCSCLSHKSHCPLSHRGWQLPPSPGLLGTNFIDGFVSLPSPSLLHPRPMFHHPLSPLLLSPGPEGLSEIQKRIE